MTFDRLSYKYHLILSVLSIILGLGIFSYSIYNDVQGTIAFKIFLVTVFIVAGFLCFLILPAAILAASILGRLFAFLPLIMGDYSLASIILFFWSIINIITFIRAFYGYNEDKEISHILL